MIYLGNGIYSDAGSSLSHGGPWKDHKYIKIVNGRYIYPDNTRDRRKQYNDNSKPNDLSGDPKHSRITVGSYRPGGLIPYGHSEHRPIEEKIFEGVQSVGTSKPTKYAKRPDGKDPNPKPGDHQHNVGKAPNSRAPRDNGNISGTRFYAKNKKFNKAVSSQGPSAAESAQRGMTKGSSKNVSTGSKTVQYQKKLSDTNKTYQKAVSSQGPSAAEKAQREKGSKKKPKSKNVNTGKPNKKKKNPFKKAISWITGSEGKVSVKK